MRDIAADLWPRARPLFHAHFSFWPDHEDLLWANTIWPVFLNCGLLADQTEEAQAWTGRNIQALVLLYAHTAMTFGAPDLRVPDHFTQQRLIFSFGSEANLDAHGKCKVTCADCRPLGLSCLRSALRVPPDGAGLKKFSSAIRCSIPDDHIDPRRSALFMARSIFRELREGMGTC